MKMKRINLLALLLLFGVPCLFAQQTDLTKDPGYFDFSDLFNLKDGESINEIYINSELLKLMSGLTENKKDNIGDFLEGLKLVRVNEFVINDKDIEKAGKVIDSIDSALLGKNWLRIIKSRDKGNISGVYVKPAPDGGFFGVVMVSLTGKGRASCVNVVGNINPEEIGKLSKQFKFPFNDKK